MEERGGKSFELIKKFGEKIRHSDSEVGRLYKELANCVGFLVDLEILKQKCNLNIYTPAVRRLQKLFNNFAKENPGILLVKTKDIDDGRKVLIGFIPVFREKIFEIVGEVVEQDEEK